MKNRLAPKDWDEQAEPMFKPANRVYEMAENLPKSAWKRLRRKAKYTIKTKPRRRPENVKERIVRERGYENRRLVCEDVAEFNYRPGKCEKTYPHRCGAQKHQRRTRRACAAS